MSASNNQQARDFDMENYDIDPVNLTDAQYQYDLKVDRWSYIENQAEIRELVDKANDLERQAYKNLDDSNPYYG